MSLELGGGFPTTSTFLFLPPRLPSAPRLRPPSVDLTRIIASILFLPLPPPGILSEIANQKTPYRPSRRFSSRRTRAKTGVFAQALTESRKKVKSNEIAGCRRRRPTDALFIQDSLIRFNLKKSASKSGTDDDGPPPPPQHLAHHPAAAVGRDIFSGILVPCPQQPRGFLQKHGRARLRCSRGSSGRRSVLVYPR